MLKMWFEYDMISTKKYEMSFQKCDVMRIRCDFN